MLFRSLFSLACISAALANPLHSRQTENTNDQINQIVDSLDMAIHVSIPNIITLQANHNASDDTIGPEIADLVTAFNSTANDLNDTPISAGSNTTRPRNDDIVVTFTTALSLTTTGISGLTDDMVPGLTGMFAPLDEAIAASIAALNRTLPGSGTLTHIMMLDARQFLADEGMTESLAALGF
ncbi:poxa3b laccase small subunit [Moniliophthora roreri MCA 2997]|uniref:Poxa3b laccase small subunit n=2 Tax=Moniliophthora roreri TaxID=221103 RepID=V2XTJ5_MONRO|nr:poxa3b laccase small subunit [Moniliophthora roreri MCA 2997]KAI3615914.1 poxa3b laccase small subunit [Moniliophthora roreri]